MIVAQNGNDVHLHISQKELNLADTLDCGQCFRFVQLEDGSFSGVAFKKLLRISQTKDQIIFYNVTLKEFHNIWNEYFDLNTDYGKIKNMLSCDSVMREAIAYSPGIRILRQDSFEALISFIISQNNNIPRIKGCIERLCRKFGDEIVDGVYAFPDAQTLACAECSDFTSLGFGYRDEYVLNCAKLVAEGKLDLNLVSGLPLESAREELLKIKGVGIKVAECALLYGFHQIRAFPVDTWMRKALAQFYPDGFPHQFASVAGIAQQYLFHYVRTFSKEAKSV